MTGGALRQGSAVVRRRLLRLVPLVALLALLWGVVLPYQAGVQIDKSLSVWVHDHPGWQMTRQRAGAYHRRYQIRWLGSPEGAPIRVTLQVQNRPIGWPTESGRQWGWAAFTLAMDPASAVQLTRWPETPWRWTGRIGWFGGVNLSMPKTDRNSGSAWLTFDPETNHWRGQLDLPGWTLYAPAHIWRFGRSAIDLDVHEEGRPLDEQTIWDIDNLVGEMGIDIRRMGWVDGSQRGLVDQLQLRFQQTRQPRGHLRDVVGSVSVESLRVQGQPLGAAQMTLALYGAEPEVGRRLIALGGTAFSRMVALQQGGSMRAFVAGFSEGRAHDELSEMLIALRRAEIRLDALRYQGPSGGFSMTGHAFGPRYVAPATETAQAPAPLRYWQAQVDLEVDDRWLVKEVPGWPRIGAPWFTHADAHWWGTFTHSAQGWQSRRHPVDISTFLPQD